MPGQSAVGSKINGQVNVQMNVYLQGASVQQQETFTTLTVPVPTRQQFSKICVNSCIDVYQF